MTTRTEFIVLYHMVGGAGWAVGARRDTKEEAEALAEEWTDGSKGPHPFKAHLLVVEVPFFEAGMYDDPPRRFPDTGPDWFYECKHKWDESVSANAEKYGLPNRGT